MSLKSRYSEYLDCYIEVGKAGNKIVGINFSETKNGEENNSYVLDDIFSYLKGEKIDLTKHKVALTLSGKKRKALEQTRNIPYGSTITYKELAESISTEKDKIKETIDSNPIPILLPTHRVVEENNIGGFPASIEIKKSLLELEGSV